MSMVCGLDLHRGQITFDALEVESRELWRRGDLCESWIPPEAVLEWRERVRLYKTLLDQRRMWIQRIHAELFQHGVSLPEGQIASSQTRDWLAGEGVGLTAAAGQRI